MDIVEFMCFSIERGTLWVRNERTEAGAKRGFRCRENGLESALPAPDRVPMRLQVPMKCGRTTLS